MTYRYLAAALMVFALTACASNPLVQRQVIEWPEIRGQVLEEGTGQPIPGAILVARWSGVGSFSHSECFHVESATADAQGNYVIPAWINNDDSNRLTYQSVQLTVYAPGYRWVRSDGPFTNEETYNTYKNFTDWIEGEARTVKYMEVDARGVRERLEYLQWLSGSVSCGSAGESKRQLYPIRKSIYQEAKVLGVSNDELQWFREVAAGAAVSTSRDVTGPEQDQAIKEFLRDNLQ